MSCFFFIFCTVKTVPEILKTNLKILFLSTNISLQRLFYKPEIYTTLNINSGNDFKISPVTYISNWHKDLGKSIVVKRF